MQNNWLRRSQADHVVVFVLGWGCDSAPIEHLTDSIPDYYDILCTYDYRTLDPADDLSPYHNRYLFAWSFGVWVAEQLFGSNATTFTRAVAFCGSPYPIDEQYGITPKRLQITIKGFQKTGTDEFNRRAYGSAYNRLKERLNRRDEQSRIEELASLYQASTQPYHPQITWDSCIIGSNDIIFPCENLLRFWGIRSEVLPLPHYPFENANLITRELEIR